MGWYLDTLPIPGSSWRLQTLPRSVHGASAARPAPYGPGMVPPVMATRPAIRLGPAHVPRPPRHLTERYRVDLRAVVGGFVARAIREREAEQGGSDRATGKRAG